MEGETISNDLSDFNFQYGEYILFQPQKVEYDTKGFAELNINNITIQNVHDSEIITIYSIYSTSSDIFIHTNREIELGPFEETNITYSIYPCKTGRVTILMFIETSIGTIPYTIDYFAERTSPISFPHRHFYFSLKMNNSITLRLNTPPGATVMFDSNVFDTEKAEFNSVYTYLPLIKQKPGLILTFVTVYNENSASYYPLFIHLFDEFLISNQELILLKYSSKQGNHNRKEINVYNPTNFTIVVKSMSIMESDRLNNFKKSDPRCHLRAYFAEHNTVQVRPGENRSIGWLSITNDFNDIVTDDLVISYSVKKYNYDGEIHIPIKANGFDCRIQVYTKAPNYGYFDQEGLKNIVIQNAGKCSQAVMKISVLSKYYKIVDFEPFILRSGEYSRPFTLMLTNEMGRFGPLEILFSTNGTEINMPFRRKSNGVKIGFPEVKDLYAKNKIFINESSILNNCWKDYTVKILNFNSYPFTIDHVFTTTGLSINFKKENKNTTVPPFQKIWLDLHVNFLPSPPFRRNDTIIFAGNGENISIAIEWTPKEGRIFFASDLNEVLTFGKEYTGIIKAFSFVREDIEFVDIETNIQANISLIRNVILGTSKQKNIATVNFSLDETFMPLRGLFEVLNYNQSFSFQNSSWSLFWRNKVYVNFSITTWIRGCQYFKSELPLRLSISTFNNLTYDFSSILTNEVYVGYVYLYNFFDLPVRFIFHNIQIDNPNFSVEYDTEMTIGPHETREVRLFFEATKEGKYKFSIPVVSNVTKPFFIHITADATYPSIRFADENGIPVTSVSFVGGDDYFYGSDPWSQCIYVQNTEPDFILLGEMNVSKPTFLRIDRDSDLIMPGESTLLCFSLIPWLYENNVTEITFSMEVNSSRYILPITVQMCQPVNNQIAKTVDSIIILFSVATLMLPVIQALINALLWIVNIRNIRWKISHRDAAIKHFSITEKIDIGIQKEEERKSKITHWVSKVRPGRALKFASEESVQNLEMLLR